MTVRVHELTAPGRGGVSVLVLSGAGALASLRRLAPRAALRKGGLSTLLLEHQGEALDEALAWVESEERVELHLHGSPVVVRGVREALGEPGARVLEAGGGTSLEARAARLCAEAAGEAAARVLLDQAEGALRRELVGLLDSPASQTRPRLASLVRRGRVVLRLVNPPRVVLAGPVNAGKSTLFNVLVGRERVVAHPESGTTRDAVRERVLFGEYVVDLIDTAGEGSLDRGGASAAIERAGQHLGRSLRRSADLVVWLAPRGEGEPDREAAAGADRPWVVLTSRADEIASSQGTREIGPRAAGALSATAAPEEAIHIVEEAFREALDLPPSPWIPGAPAPFDPDDVDRLAGLAGPDVSREALRRGLETLLSR